MLDRTAVVVGRRRRWLRRLLVGVCGLIVLSAIVGLCVITSLHKLERPWIKRHLLGFAREAGVELEYRRARIDVFSGLEIEGVVVRSPLEFRAFAPELLRVGRVNARWSLATLLFDHASDPAVDSIAVSDVSLNVVIDEHGRTTFDAFGSKSPAQPSVPLSKLAAKFLHDAPPLSKLAVERVTATLIRTARGEVFDRVQLSGAGVDVRVHSAAPSARGYALTAALGSSAAPLPLQVSRTHHGEPTRAARANLWLTLDASSSSLSAALDLRMLEQSFVASVASVSAERWLHVDAQARFDPSAGRTQIEIEHVQAGDGAVLAEASIELPDAGDPIVHRAHADLDLARLLRWLPVGLVPVTAERARLRCQIDGLVASSVVRVADAGAVAIDADMSNVAFAAPTGRIAFATAGLDLHLQPTAAKGIAGQGSLKLTGARLAANGEHLAVDDVALNFDGEQSPDGVIEGRIGVRFGRLERQGAVTLAEHRDLVAVARRSKGVGSAHPPDRRDSAGPILARQGSLELRLHQLHPDLDVPLATHGDVALSLELGAIDIHTATQARALLDGVTLHLHTALSGHAPYAAELEARAARLSVFGRDGKLVANTPAHLDVRARDLAPNLAVPAASSGELHAAIDLGDMQAALDATKAAGATNANDVTHTGIAIAAKNRSPSKAPQPADALDYALQVTASSLKAVRPFLPANLIDAAPWDRIGLALQSSGRVEHLSGAPAIEQTTQLDVQRPSFDNIAARSASLKIQSQGTALQHHLDLDLRAQGLVLNEGDPSDDHLTLTATLDRTRPALQFQLGSDGRATTQLSGSLTFDRARRALAYKLDGRLGGLEPVAPFIAKLHGLDAVDVTQLEVAISTEGWLFGVIADIARDGTLKLEPDPARTALVEGTTDLHLAHLRWAKGDIAIVAPALTWHGAMHGVEDRRSLETRLEVGTLHVDLGDRNIDLNSIDNQATLTIIGPLAQPELEITQRLAIRAIEQTVVPEYPLGQVLFTLEAERAADGVVHISDLKIANGKGGTDLAVNGNIDLSEGRRTLSVTTTLAQDLAQIATIPERFKGTGKLVVEANVTSPDFALYRVRAAVKGENVSFTLGQAGYDVQNANGEVPITVELAAAEGGVRFERSDKRNPYSMLRFADQHPLLSRSGFLSIGRLKTPFVLIEPLVGNLEIDQNVVSLRQFEMGVRGGSITGQCGLDWDGPDSTLELHVRANGVKSSHGEPFDGNIAVAISAADRTIDGRAEILRIGERHLLDLLDLQDPLRVDPAMNRVRSALGFGYPKSLRLIFDHGFASAHLELGGLAQFVSIGELRGIPMGPIVDKMLARMLDGRDVKEMP